VEHDETAKLGVLGPPSRRVMRNWLRRHKKSLPTPILQALAHIKRHWFGIWAQDSYAQNGEDLILQALFEDKEPGFYVDVGAHHPKRYSNTYRLYCRGWRGLNIDAMPGSMRPFRRFRPRDINVEAAVASVSQELTFYIFEDLALNTCDRNLASEHAAEGRPPIREVLVQAVPLWKLLDQYVPRNIKIDLLTIDVEGLDFDVLESNDWARYAPDYILVECLGMLPLDKICSNKVTQFLSEHHYSSIAKTIHTVLYKRNVPGDRKINQETNRISIT